MPIRNSLPRVQRATYAVGMAMTNDPQEVPVPMGSGFFVGHDGVFLTAHHVVAKGTRPRILIQEQRERSPGSVTVSGVLAQDAEADFALLTVDPARFEEDPPITYLKPSGRVLDEGEPVYAYG